MMDRIIKTGRQAALAAGEVLRRNYLQPHHITLKSAIDPVTETDLQSQETIISLIHQTFPEHGFLAEEGRVGEGGPGSTASPSGSQRLTAWTRPCWPPAFLMTSGSVCRKPLTAWEGCWESPRGGAGPGPPH